MLEETYLPFEIEELATHFDNKNHLQKFQKTIKKYKKFNKGIINRKGLPLDDMIGACQIEKDETVWTASCFTQLYKRKNFKSELVILLDKAFGGNPPLKGFNNWEECIEPDVKIYIEANLPSPKSYQEYLAEKINEILIPYIRDSAYEKKRLEGPTHVDALIVNPSNGFAVLFEAKVYSDISYQVTYDETRNQIIRNIDVMLEKNNNLIEDLNRRKPENTLFALLTPRKFKTQYPHSRFYSCIYQEYKSNPIQIQKDLPHRKDIDYEDLSRRIGWLTWEDFKDLSSGFCKWLD